MKKSEFYEKYWTVDGKPVPPLDPKEKEIWDIAEENGVPPYVKCWSRKRGGWYYEIHPIIKEILEAS